jgi:two-component system sensor histidine kinase KdpD
MLDRGHQLRAEGVDVVVGFVETHGRKETAALLGGLEIIPEKIRGENGITYRELDRERVIARKPQVRSSTSSRTPTLPVRSRRSAFTTFSPCCVRAST